MDYELVLSFARGAQAAGAQSLCVVSAVAADCAARNFYLRVKGETEVALEALRFRSLHIMQPGLLLGSRPQRRVLEAVARGCWPLLNPLLLGRWQRYRAIDARTVAAAMRAATLSGRAGTQRYTWAGLQSLGRSGKVPTRM